MKISTKRLCISFIIAVFGFSTVAMGIGTTKTIKAVLNAYTIKVNGKKLTNNTIYYNKNVYAPVNAIAAAMKGKGSIDSKASVVNLSTDTETINKLTEANKSIAVKDAEIDLIKQSNNDLKAESEKLKAELNLLKSDNENLKNELAKQKVEIDQLNKQIIANGGVPNGFPLSVTTNNMAMKINNVIQDSDSLRIYVTYINNTKEKMMTFDSLAKVMVKGNEYVYDYAFNFNRYNGKEVDHVPAYIEPGVAANSVIFMNPIKDISTINVVLNANYQEFKFYNIKVGIQ